jgi:hypothetical protein
MILAFDLGGGTGSLESPGSREQVDRWGFMCAE